VGGVVVRAVEERENRRTRKEEDRTGDRTKKKARKQQNNDCTAPNYIHVSSKIPSIVFVIFHSNQFGRKISAGGKKKS